MVISAAIENVIQGIENLNKYFSSRKAKETEGYNIRLYKAGLIFKSGIEFTWWYFRYRSPPCSVRILQKTWNVFYLTPYEQ